MDKLKIIQASWLVLTLFLLSSCFGGKTASLSGRGGEVVGVRGKAFTEPTPYGMVRVDRGYLKMGIENQDTLWGTEAPVKDISVDGFGWMRLRLPILNINSLFIMCGIPFARALGRSSLWR